MRIDHFHFLCHDAEKTANFFVRHFDGEHYDTIELADWRILRVRVGDIVLAFSPLRGSAPHYSASSGRGFDHIGITVSDLDSLLDNLRQDGAEVMKEPTTNPLGTRIALVRAPDEIQIELLQPVTKLKGKVRHVISA